MAQVNKAIAGAAGLVIATLLLSGCAAIQQFLTEAPIDLPAPSLPTAGDPLETTYDGGTTPDNIGDSDWAKKSKRRVIAAGAAHKIVVYSVEPTAGSQGLTVRIKGDPADAQLLADVEQYVVPVALKWAPTATVIIDPSLCGIVGEVRDDSPVCDALGNLGSD